MILYVAKGINKYYVTGRTIQSFAVNYSFKIHQKYIVYLFAAKAYEKISTEATHENVLEDSKNYDYILRTLFYRKYSEVICVDLENDNYV